MTTTHYTLVEYERVEAAERGYVALGDAPVPVIAAERVADAVGIDGLVHVFDLPKSTLRSIAERRTPSGRRSAEAKRASDEIARRKANAAAKRAALRG